MLRAVAAVSRGDVWAVGTVDGTPVVARWNGRRWVLVQTPPLGDASLYDLAATSGGHVWVAGEQEVRVTVTDPDDAGVVRRPLVLHWNGETWDMQDLSALVPECPYHYIPDAPDWVWACGTFLSAIDAASPGNVWAVGTIDAVTDWSMVGVLLRSNGRRWSRSFRGAPNAGVHALSVTVAAPNDAWTLENYIGGPSGSPWRYRLTHWRGRKPRQFDYRRQGASLSELAASSSTSVWIVGWNSMGSKRLGPLVVHSNGRSAVRQRTALDSLRYATLASVDAVSPTEVWAAGDHLLARYSR